jgi:hypothetical protein
VTDDEILLGLALTVVLATGSQILASRPRVPALIILLPVGFAAGALTDIIHPDKLLGQDFSDLVDRADSEAGQGRGGGRRAGGDGDGHAGDASTIRKRTRPPRVLKRPEGCPGRFRRVPDVKMGA